MKRRFLLLVLIALICLAALAAAPPGPASPSVTPGAKSRSQSPAALPWSDWFEKNTTISDKKTYVHFLWDANAVRGQFEGSPMRGRIAEAGRQLARLRYPTGASADQIRMDIVFITKRDGYGNPRWDSIQRLAHLEFSRKKLLETPAGGESSRGYEKFEVFR